MRPVMVVSLCVLGSLVGCSAEPRASRPELLPVPDVPVAAVAPDAGEHDTAVARWQGFVATRTPRPLVFEYPTQDASLVSPDLSSAELPPVPPTATVTVEPPAGPGGPFDRPTEQPGEPVELPLAAPAAALEAMRAAAGARPVSADLLKPVTRVVLSSDRVTLDRGGEATIPVWRFSLASGRTVSWPAPPPDDVRTWDRPRLSGDSNTLSEVAGWTVPGTDPAVIRVVLPRSKVPCSDQPTYRYEPRVTETASAVVVSAARVRVDVDVPPGSPCDQSLAWAGDEHLVLLAAPLGGRVVVDRNGAPVPWHPGRWQRP